MLKYINGPAVFTGPELTLAFGGIDLSYYNKVAKETINATHVSTGLCSVYWLIENKAKQIDVIGYGYAGSNDKRYPDGKEDKSELRWADERHWIESQPNVNML